MEILDSVLEYLPTAIVTFALGVIAQRVIRAGKRDEIDLQRDAQEAANHLSALEGAMDARLEDLRRKDDELKDKDDEIERQRRWRMEAEDRERQLHAIVVGQIEVEAMRTATIDPLASDRVSS